MSKFYFLKVKEVHKETEDTVTIHFWHPLNEVLKYKPGQFITLLIDTGEEKKVRRSYSMSSSPFTDVSVAITAKKISNGSISGYLNETLKVGDVVEVMEPMGVFTLNPNSEKKRAVVLIGAGSGITPLMSMAKSVLIVEPESVVYLLYGNREESTIIFADQIDALTTKYKSRFQVIHTLSQPSPNWKGETGRLTQANISRFLEQLKVTDGVADYYLCGPAQMMDEAKKALEDLHVPADKVHRESFLTSQALASTEGSAENSLKRREITLKYEGNDFKLVVEPHQTILEAALENDIDLPYSCQAGMCTACMGRTLEGEVHLDENEALTNSELSDGFILTCVAHPLTDDVIVEVD